MGQGDAGGAPSPHDRVAPMAVRDREHQVPRGSTAATTNASVAPGTAGITSPGTTACSAGTMLVELGVPPLSMESQLYQPARPPPICAIHGQTSSGGASIVTAWGRREDWVGNAGIRYWMQVRPPKIPHRCGILSTPHTGLGHDPNPEVAQKRRSLARQSATTCCANPASGLLSCERA
jgi:hypothetical protein